MKVLLYSGGLDSWLIDKLWKPDVKLYIDIKGDYSKQEKRKLPKDVRIIECPTLSKFENHETKFIPLRNLYFLMIASNYGDKICLGATGGDWGNKDKTPFFLDETESLLNYLLSDKKVRKKIEIEKGFIHIYKNELIERYLKQEEGNINKIKENTFSCYTPRNNKECFECFPCFRKFCLMFYYGAIYSYEERKKMWKYVKNNIIPTKEQGGYKGTYYTERGHESQCLIWAVDKLKKEFNK